LFVDVDVDVGIEIAATAAIFGRKDHDVDYHFSSKKHY
jgi:hypothetical protein